MERMVLPCPNCEDVTESINHNISLKDNKITYYFVCLRCCMVYCAWQKGNVYEIGLPVYVQGKCKCKKSCKCGKKMGEMHYDLEFYNQKLLPLFQRIMETLVAFDKDPKLSNTASHLIEVARLMMLYLAGGVENRCDYIASILNPNPGE